MVSEFRPAVNPTHIGDSGAASGKTYRAESGYLLDSRSQPALVSLSMRPFDSPEVNQPSLTLAAKWDGGRLPTSALSQDYRRAAALIRAAMLLCVFLLRLTATPAGQSTKPMSAFEGQAIVHSLDDHVIRPDGAKVWVLFGSIVLYEGMPDRYDYIDSAALYFQNQRNSYWEKVNKALKRALKDQKQKQPSQAGVVGQSDPEAANEFHGLSLKVDDEALAATLEWAEKNRDKTWQVKVLPTDADGKWFVGDLKPGWYFIVVRARFGEFDAAWEANIMVQPGQTFTVPLAPSVVYKRSN